MTGRDLTTSFPNIPAELIENGPEKIEPATCAKLVQMLFEMLQFENQPSNMVAVQEMYISVVSEFPKRFVKSVIEDYLTGKRGNRRFVPTMPELAGEIRDLQAEGRREYLIGKKERDSLDQEIARRRRREEIDKQKTPESRAAVGEMLARTKQALAEMEIKRIEAEPKREPSRAMIQAQEERERRWQEDARQASINAMQKGPFQ